MSENLELGRAEITVISAALIHVCRVCDKTVPRCKSVCWFIHRTAASCGMEHTCLVLFC